VQREVLFGNKSTLEAFDRIHALSDPLDRLSTVIQAMIDPHAKWESNKPFNPVLGEFVCHKAGSDYELKIEQISHHPPINSFSITGPHFILSTPEGVSPSNGFSIGYNCIQR
jgi:Oxysterol-binding protein